MGRGRRDSSPRRVSVARQPRGHPLPPRPARAHSRGAGRPQLQHPLVGHSQYWVHSWDAQHSPPQQILSEVITALCLRHTSVA